MYIGVVAVDGAFGAGLASLLDLFGVAEVLRPSVDPAIAPIEVEVRAPVPEITCGNGLRRRADGDLTGLAAYDVVVVAALGSLDVDGVTAALATRQVREVVTAVEAIDPVTTQVAAACTGTFALGDAGVLDGGPATTSWWLAPIFRRRYPRVEVQQDTLVVAGPRAVTAGAAFAHVDLALTLLGEVSPTLADRVARHLVVDRRTAQSGYLAIDHLTRTDPLVRAFEQHVRADLAGRFDLPTVAAGLGTTPRTLQRRVREATGVTPLGLVQRLRVERAHHLRRTTDHGLDRIAHEVGYAHASTLRALLRREEPPVA